MHDSLFCPTILQGSTPYGSEWCKDLPLNSRVVYFALDSDVSWQALTCAGCRHTLYDYTL